MTLLNRGLNLETENNVERDLLLMTADIVAAFVVKNKIDADAVSALIITVASALSSIGEPVVDTTMPVQQMTAAQARKLITPAGIVSLINDKPFKSMKRHLSLSGYTPASYREAFGLPADFPMVHPEYAARRSELARAAGLGFGGRKPALVEVATKAVRKPPAPKS